MRFSKWNCEIRVGYFNINGLLEGNHAEYHNSDHNLKNLDILVIAETKLNKNYDDEIITRTLNKWNFFNRYDSNDGMKHMGLMLLTSKESSILNQFRSITYIYLLIEMINSKYKA